MQDEGEDVTGDKNPVIQLGSEACVLGTEVEDAFPPVLSVTIPPVVQEDVHLVQCDVDGCCEKGWGKSDADWTYQLLSKHFIKLEIQELTNLQKKASKRERIFPKHDSAAVSKNFGNTTPEHADNEEEIPSPLEAHGEMYNHGDTEEDQERDICSERRSILVDTGFHRTQSQRAIGVWAVDDIVAGGVGHGWREMLLTIVLVEVDNKNNRKKSERER